MTTNSASPLKIFMIGNNPIDVSEIYSKLKEYASDTFQADYGFDLRKAFRYIRQNRPSCVLIDDNIGRSLMEKFVKRLSAHQETRDIPLTIIKNSNYRESFAANATDFILKEGLSAEMLKRTILRTIRMKGFQRSLSSGT